MCVYIYIICRHTLQSKQSVVARDVSHVGVNEFHVRSNEGERVCVVFVVVDLKASDCCTLTYLLYAQHEPRR